MAEKGMSTREMYQVSKENVNHALKLLVSVRQETTNAPALEKDFDNIYELAKHLMLSHQSEPASDYKIAFLGVANWIFCAINRTYIQNNCKKAPSAAYAIKKGFEVCHLLLHRDLRRKQLSTTESQLFYEFQHLTKSLPSPTTENLVALQNGENTKRKTS